MAIILSVGFSASIFSITIHQASIHHERTGNILLSLNFGELRFFSIGITTTMMCQYTYTLQGYHLKRRFDSIIFHLAIVFNSVYWSSSSWVRREAECLSKSKFGYERRTQSVTHHFMINMNFRYEGTKAIFSFR